MVIALAILMADPGVTTASRIAIEPYVSGLRYPVDINHAGDGTNRLFVVEQEGRIRIIKNGAVLSTAFLDIRDRVQCCGEQGLLGVAFHPAYPANRHFYVNYTSRERDGVAAEGATVIARYEASVGDPYVADPDSEQIILVVDQPFSNHNAGKLLFSPIDGYLYIPLGDGGLGGDPGNRAQDPTTLLGKVLRIDVDSAFPYGIPPDNPFVESGDALSEIWALGLRNPWRFSFDRLTGDLYIGDVGQDDWEEIDYQAAASPGGLNFGWRCREGTYDFDFSPECATLDLTDPIVEYGRDQGYSVTGGFVYRGSKYPALFGKYFFADFGSGRIWTVHQLGPDTWSSAEEALDTNLRISTFGEGDDGELYLAHRSSNNGTIYRIVDICEGDLNTDGRCNILDWQLFIQDWGATKCNEPGVECECDLNEDGSCDISDYQIFIQDWGRKDCPVSPKL